MDKKLVKAIKKQYAQEYLYARLSAEKGFAGKVIRKISDNPSRKTKTVLGLAAAFEVAVWAGAGVIGGGVVPALVAVGATNVLKAPVNVPVGIAVIKAQRAANKAMDADIASGKLVERYKADMQKPKPPKGPKL